MDEHLFMELVERIQSRFYGKYRGTVTDVDESAIPRIKASVPAVLGEAETVWCMPCVPYAGDQAGMAFFPEVGAGVWIEFEGGDVSYPIWAGCYWHDGEVPGRVKPKVKVITTPGNQSIVLDDDDNSITITDSNDNRVTLDADGITVQRGGGKLVVSDGKIDANDGAMEVT